MRPNTNVSEIRAVKQGEVTYGASIFITASSAAIHPIFVFAGADYISSDLDGTDIALFGCGLILEYAQPCKAIYDVDQQTEQ
jgi:hypothetical protein